MKEKTRIIRGGLLTMVGTILWGAYLLKWVPFPEIPMNQIQLIVNTVWCYIGWIPGVIILISGLKDIENELQIAEKLFH